MPRITPQSAPADVTTQQPTAAAKSRKKTAKQRRPRQAAVRRVNPPVDATNFKVGQDRPRDLPTDGPARLTSSVIEPANGIHDKKYLAMLAFMKEPVTVVVATTTDKNAEPIVPIWVNGRSQYFPRGVAITCKRMFVEGLCRARTTGFSQETYRDANGDTAIRNHPNTALRYPFSVTNDDNPNGRAWLEKVLAEA